MSAPAHPTAESMAGGCQCADCEDLRVFREIQRRYSFPAIRKYLASIRKPAAARATPAGGTEP